MAETQKKLSPIINSTSPMNRSEFKRVFIRFDEDGDGKISPAELRILMKRSAGQELSLEDAKAMVDSTDSNGDGLLELDEFIKLVCEKQIEEEEEDGNDEEDLKEAFGMYTMEGEGSCITAKSLKRMLSRLGTSRDVEECMTMICRFDVNGDGVLSFEEFKAMMMY